MALTIRVVLDLLVISFLFSFNVLQQKTNAQSLRTLQNPRLMKCGFDKIYQLGDSLADTGNCIRENLCARRLGCGRFPYGMNISQKKSSGRCSNGMLIIDFIALGSGLPLLNPYKLKSANFTHGVNFAVAGATALSAQVMAKKKIVNAATNSSLSVQLAWMSSHFKTSTDVATKLKKALFLVGEVGGNDFNHGLLQDKRMEELRNMVPEIVQTIIHGVRRVIGFGATRIVVPGNFPIGCLPIYLTKFRTDNSTAYDEHHCLKDLNNFAVFYNQHLQQAIQKLKKRYSKITLIYGDYYNAYLWVLRNAVTLGFDKNSLQKACCGIGGGDYNFDIRKLCGSPGVPICADPSTYIGWDGIHLTQQAYKWLSRWLINDMLPKLNCQ